MSLLLFALLGFVLAAIVFWLFTISPELALGLAGIVAVAVGALLLVRTDLEPAVVVVQQAPKAPPVVKPAAHAAVDRAQPAEPAAHPIEAEDPLQPLTDLEPQRPKWIDAGERLVDGVYQKPVKSGIFSTREECQQALDKKMGLIADEYIDRDLGAGAAELVALDPAFINDRIKQQEYVERVKASVGAMQQVHVLLQFDEAVRADVRDRWQTAIVSERLRLVGLASVLVLAALGSLAAYFRWTG